MASHNVLVLVVAIFAVLLLSRESEGRKAVINDDSIPRYHGNLPVKTILADNGDIVDCVNIYDQPAFDNPALRNHKIQTRPSSFPYEKGVKGNLGGTFRDIFQTSLTTVSCPYGTVPILRPKNQLHAQRGAFF